MFARKTHLVVFRQRRVVDVVELLRPFRNRLALRQHNLLFLRNPLFVQHLNCQPGFVLLLDVRLDVDGGLARRLHADALRTGERRLASQTHLGRFVLLAAQRASADVEDVQDLLGFVLCFVFGQHYAVARRRQWKQLPRHHSLPHLGVRCAFGHERRFYRGGHALVKVHRRVY